MQPGESLTLLLDASHKEIIDSRNRVSVTEAQHISVSVPCQQIVFSFVFYRHQRVRENTIASFKSAAKHVSCADD